MSTFDQEQAEGRVAFKEMNKTLQLMLTFGVRGDKIVDFVEATINMKLFNNDTHLRGASERVVFVGPSATPNSM